MKITGCILPNQAKDILKVLQGAGVIEDPRSRNIGVPRGAQWHDRSGESRAQFLKIKASHTHNTIVVRLTFNKVPKKE